MQIPHFAPLSLPTQLPVQRGVVLPLQEPPKKQIKHAQKTQKRKNVIQITEQNRVPTEQDADYVFVVDKEAEDFELV
jgi:hypothetical protein